MTTALQGTFNFRDLGGLPLEGGGTTAVGVLYRSDALHALTPAGEAESPCKDRTGVCAAVLLDAVGVTRDAIIADYTASATHLAGPWLDAITHEITRFGVEITPALAELIAGVRPAAQSARSDLDVDD